MSDNEEEYAMLKAMGFTSFGTSQRPPKEPKEPPTGEFAASGANNAPLPKRAKTNTTSKLAPLSSSPPTFSTTSFFPPSSFTSQSRSNITATAPLFTPVSILSAPPPGVSRPPSHEARYESSPGTGLQLSLDSFARPAGGPPPGTGTAPQLAPDSFARPPAYTSPLTGISFTSRELNELKRGKRNEKGDLVFFQPSFVDEDPWKGLKGRLGVRRRD